MLKLIEQGESKVAKHRCFSVKRLELNIKNFICNVEISNLAMCVVTLKSVKCIDK